MRERSKDVLDLVFEENSGQEMAVQCLMNIRTEDNSPVLLSTASAAASRKITLTENKIIMEEIEIAARNDRRCYPRFL